MYNDKVLFYNSGLDACVVNLAVSHSSLQNITWRKITTKSKSIMLKKKKKISHIFKVTNDSTKLSIILAIPMGTYLSLLDPGLRQFKALKVIQVPPCSVPCKTRFTPFQFTSKQL